MLKIKMLMTKTKGDVNKQRDRPCSWIERLNIEKMSILPKLISKFNAPIKIPARRFCLCFCGHRQTYSKIYMERHRSSNS